jgi:hypothetical protein
MKRTLARYAFVPLLAVAASCGREFEGVGELRARRVVLEREIAGLRQVVARLERGDSLLPASDIAIAVEDTLVRDLVAAQLPVVFDVDRYHVELREAEVQFRGGPAVRLVGQIQVRDRPSLAAVVELVGGLDDIRVDPASSTLRATLAVDHVAIAETEGVAQFLSGSALEEASRLVRLQVAELLPAIQIPVRLRSSIDFPAVTEGPVRMTGARMPLAVSVSQVTAERGRLWIAVHLEPGAIVKVADAPPAGDASASEAGATLGTDGAATGAGRRPAPKDPVRR